jgi:hypothetical protein
MKVIRKDSNSISKQGVDGNKGFITSIKEETNVKSIYIVEKKMSRFLEQGFYSKFKTIRRPFSN